MKNHGFLFIVMTLSAYVMLFSSCGGDDDAPTPTPTYQEPSDNPDNGSDIQESFQVMQTCYTCKGEKGCINCKGTGKGCSRCDGKGKYCSSCGTTGKDSSCNGNGRCKKCDGSGIEYCDYCRSSPGLCHTCNGLGWWHNPDNLCYTCKGNKVCPHCHGNYQQQCSRCNGDGKCKYCSGSGVCPTCYGNPTCSLCGGDGHCSLCNGNGKCSECQGTGEETLRILAFNDTGGDEKVFIHAKSEWNVTTDADWLTFSRSSGNGDYTLIITAEKNNTINRRESIITFTSGSTKITIEIIQYGEAIKLDVDQTSVFVWCFGLAENTINVTSNTSWTVTAADSWVTCSPSSGSGDATVAVSASDFYDGTRYTTLTFSDTSGEISKEVVVAQALYPDAVNALKTLFEKPFGTIDVDLKSSSYEQVRNAVLKVYKFSYESSVFKRFQISYVDNPSLTDIMYQGLSLYNFTFEDSNSYNSVEYSFSLDKSQDQKGYKYYLYNILQDFKYTLGAILNDEGSNQYYIELWSGRDANNNLCGIRVREYSDDYSFQIYCYYDNK